MATLNELHEYLKEYHCWVRPLHQNIYEIQTPAQYKEQFNKILADNNIVKIGEPTLFKHGVLDYFCVVIDLERSYFV